jgi:hypothetical protein
MTPLNLARSVPNRRAIASVCLSLLLAIPLAAVGQEPTLTSVTPAHGASEVSRTDPIIFVFSEPMDPEFTEAEFIHFIDFTTFQPITAVAPSWSPDQTTLTYTPTEPLPANAFIVWYVDGTNLEGEWLSDEDLEPDGYFMTTTGNGNGSNGSNTNAITSFSVQHLRLSLQDSAEPPIIEPDYGYEFFASTILASNRTANAVSVQLPTGETEDLQRLLFQPWFFGFGEDAEDAETIEALYPPGDYIFTVRNSTDPDLVVTVNLPPFEHPNPPYIANFADAQRIDPAQPFTLSWQPLANGTANDFIQLEIYGFTTIDTYESIFSTPDFDEPGALPGTATSVVIPAHTLESDRVYDAFLTFFRWTVNTTHPEYWTFAGRLSETDFTVATLENGGPVTGPVSIANTTVTPDGTLSFNVISAPGQVVAIEAAGRVDASEWISLLTTVNTTGTLPFTDPTPATSGNRFYRVRSP